MYNSFLADINTTKLQKATDELRSKFNGLEDKKKDLMNQIKQQFSSINKTLYVLKGIIIHDGSPNFGHYTCYVKQNKQWYFFDDTNVVQVSQEQVYSEARGDGKKAKNLYALVYIKQEIDSVMSPLDQVLPKDLIDYINSQDTIIAKEQKQDRLEIVAQKFFFKRKEIIEQRSYQSFYNSTQHPRINSFDLYLFDKQNGQNLDNHQIFIYYLLDEIVKGH